MIYLFTAIDFAGAGKKSVTVSRKEHRAGPVEKRDGVNVMPGGIKKTRLL
jgi:hypothetical protein